VVVADHLHLVRRTAAGLPYRLAVLAPRHVLVVAVPTALEQTQVMPLLRTQEAVVLVHSLATTLKTQVMPVVLVTASFSGMSKEVSWPATK
jgi:hypothetical protein